MNTGHANPVTAEELAAGLADILGARKDDGPVTLLCVRPKPNHRLFPDTITLSKRDGVAGDFEMSRPWLTLPDGKPDPRIQVAIISSRVLDLCWRERDRVIHPGDTIAADMDVTEANLPAGTLLSVGSSILRVSDVPNEGCVKWKVRYGRAAFQWTSAPANAHLRLRGLFCSVEQDGEISVGDRIRRC